MNDQPQIAEGYLFDIYHAEERMYVWIKDFEGHPHLFHDFYCPVIYAKGEEYLLRKLVGRLYQLNALASPPLYESRKLFYENRSVPVLKLIISKPSILNKITKKLYALYGKFDIYHSDIDVSTGYMYEKGLYPLCKLQIQYNDTPQGKIIQQIKSETLPTDLEYQLPSLKTIQMYMKQNHRIGIRKENPIIIETKSKIHELYSTNPRIILEKLDIILKEEDPDIILSAYGDQYILPYIFTQAQKIGFVPALDRDVTAPIRRNIVTKGTSYNTYGVMVFRAPAYPLFGRWHIDSSNSFVYKESELLGTIELARLSRLPVQRMARASTGKALTYIETDVAFRRGYLIPWQKSAVESPKTALQLLEVDKGGLVFQPDVSYGKTAENVAQLDFAQMYPTIMVLHNISPECVNCPCCSSDPTAPVVPKASYHICNKRLGVVSEALEHVLERRKYYKKREKETTGKISEEYKAKQASLKWMLVTSFGYLGYRNAKFGRLESHESVNAFSREKLLTAKEIVEERGYVFIHAITDSIFIRKSDSSAFSKLELDEICSEIFKQTNIEISVDGIYSWVVFVPSTQDPEMPVANRYMGRFNTGELKYRGIGARRKDLPVFVKSAQIEMLEWMKGKETIRELRSAESEILRIFQKYDTLLAKGQVLWEDLLLRKTASRESEEYEVDNATALSVNKLSEMGIQVQAGEKVRYIVSNRNSKTKGIRYITEEEMYSNSRKKPPKIDVDFYRKLLLSAFKEIWVEFSSFWNFNSLIDDQLYLPFREKDFSRVSV
ncbi:DNA polymerase [Leptospira perolatii]|uniref:DNA-directed DNA polymerase n=1 Tax=Leptospira perolatii TaxID=2023191 RepID=A0A2M9ZI80_9LEPT|nr:DNA polymerase domain-containing protein [Leptospira perolatii]PJZ68228.1 DNA polymerase [Leptospira perolatii]PJZ71775.1 DNA polymerase [Leptospira perolatii]